MRPELRVIDSRLLLPPAWTNIKPYEHNPLIDIFVALFYFLMIFLFLRYLSRRKIRNRFLQKAFIQGWLFRIGGGIFIYVFYAWYYGGGDTINYLKDAQTLLIMLYEIPVQGLQYLILSIAKKDFLGTLLEINDVYYFARNNITYFLFYLIDYSSEMVAFFTLPFMLFAAGSRYAAVVLVGTISFLASWAIYRVFLRQYPRHAKPLALSLLYLPSLNVWTGSPFKETYALIGISLMIYGIYEILYQRKWLWLPLVIFGVWMTYTVKPYVALAILPWAAIWVYLTLNKSMRHPLYRYFFSPILFFIFLGLSYLGILSLGAETGKYSLTNIPGQAYLVYSDLKQNYTYYQETGGSVYDIGDFEPTMGGMLSKLPIATLTAMYRPFLWEAGKPVILMAALETFVLLILTLINLLRYGILGVIKRAVSDPFLIFCFGYSVFFLFMVGLTSGNFGNLVRYRVPGYIFFMSALFVTFGKLRDAAYRHRRR